MLTNKRCELLPANANQAGDNTQCTVNLQGLHVLKRNYKSHLWWQGVDQYGHSVFLRIQDFEPSFLVQPPDEDWEEDELEDFVETLEKNLYREDAEQSLVTGEFVSLTPAIGFTNGRKDTLIKLTFANIDAYEQGRKQLGKEKYTLYHADFEYANQFIQQTGTSYETWYDVSRVFWTSRRQTHANLEGQISMQDIRASSHTGPPPCLKCFVRMKAVSRDGVMKRRNAMFKPDPYRHCDRAVAYSLAFTWNNDPEAKVVREVVYSIMPMESLAAAESKNVQYVFCTSEVQMMQRLAADFVSYDPDDIFYFPDYFDVFTYFAIRAQLFDIPQVLKIERWKHKNLRVVSNAGKVQKVLFNTRTMFNMERALTKKVFIQVELYQLYKCSAHKDLRKQPANLDNLLTDYHLTNQQIARGVQGRALIFKQLRQDIELMIALEKDMGMRFEYANVSKASDTNLTHTVTRGEQIRVYNKLTHLYVQGGFYVNPSKIVQKPLKFNIRERPPTFQDPPDLKINTDLRAQYRAEYLARQAQHDPAIGKKLRKTSKKSASLKFAAKSDAEEHEEEEEEEEEEKELAGGNVVLPSPKFYGEERVFVWDFASLYPSIMRAYNISYETVVFDPEYLDLPGVKYTTVSINNFETVVIANVTGIIPNMLKMLVNKRRAIKKEMAAETDPFKKKIKDFEQNSMKVLCNATYGFCGAAKGMLSVRAVMFVVTSLGRYLQKACTNYVGEKYGIRTIYGDTDSIFVLQDLWLPPNCQNKNAPENTTIEELCWRTGQKFGMDTFWPDKDFTWANVVAHYRTRKKKPLDITQFSYYNQINAFSYLISDKLCAELTNLFPDPVEMEFENMSNMVSMDIKKKNYDYNFWAESDPSKIKKSKTQGKASKKRDWCHFTRNVLGTIEKYTRAGRFQDIEPFLDSELTRLVEGKVSMEELEVSKGYKSRVEYKNMNTPHLQVVQKLEKRMRYPMKEHSRFMMVIVKGEGKTYNKSETPAYAKKHKLDLDLVYYLKKQFWKPVSKALIYHSHRFNFHDKMNHYLFLAQCKMKNQGFLSFRKKPKLVSHSRPQSPGKAGTGTAQPVNIPRLSQKNDCSPTESTAAKRRRRK